MRKIPTLFVRDPDNRRYVTEEVTPGCEWVLAGEGRPTRKWDGTCVMFDGDAWWSRREVKVGRPIPAGYQQVDYDPVTEKSVGWEPIEQSGFSKFHMEACRAFLGPTMPGTYELIGPKINGNPEGRPVHGLKFHGAEPVWFPLEPDANLIKHTVRRIGGDGVEGVVWHHPDGRMAKLKARDLRPAPPADVAGETNE